MLSMAGRPRKLAANMTRLECDAFCLCADLYLTMPRRYAAPAPTTRREHDPVWEGWRRCTDLSMMLSIELLKQANRLRLKADLPPIVNDA